MKKLPHVTGAAVCDPVLRTKTISKGQGKDPDGSNRDVILGTIPGFSRERQRNTTQNTSQNSDGTWDSLRSARHPPDTSSLLGTNIFPAIVIIAVVCTELTVLWDVTPCNFVGFVGFLRNVHAVN